MNNQTKLHLIAGILLTLFSGLTILGQTGDMNTLITPTSAGDIKLGMTVAEARKAAKNLEFVRGFGDENSLAIDVKQNGTEMLLLSADEGLEWDGQSDPPPLNEQAKIVYIEILSPVYRTAEGIHVGATLADAEIAYGPLKNMHNIPHLGETGEFANQPKDVRFTFRAKGDFASAGIYEEIPDCKEQYPPLCSVAVRYNPGSYINGIQLTVSGEQ